MSAKHEDSLAGGTDDGDKSVPAPCYNLRMTVQTIPDIDKMSGQQIELMEALWKNISEKNVNSEPPDWHLKYLEDREKAVADGEDSFITLDAFDEDLRSGMK